MNRGIGPELLTDLARWERGAVRMDDVTDAHPDAPARLLLETHAWVAFLASDQTDEPGPAWDEVAARLPERAPAEDPATVATREAGRSKRIIAGLLAAAVLAPASAVAASTDSGRAFVDHTARQVARFVVPQFSVPGDSVPEIDSVDAVEPPDAAPFGTTVLVPAASVTESVPPTAGAPAGDPAVGTPASPTPPVASSPTGPGGDNGEDASGGKDDSHGATPVVSQPGHPGDDAGGGDGGDGGDAGDTDDPGEVAAPQPDAGDEVAAGPGWRRGNGVESTRAHPGKGHGPGRDARIADRVDPGVEERGDEHRGTSARRGGRGMGGGGARTH
ncbi:MAG TPA: hypothetical protein VM618_08380 [Acidimicrobiia bacterium]|nr:hypothetical protein [Acidimicrobiia bacterium]